MGDGAQTSALKGMVSEAEWKARVELAALYRLVALNRWDDLIFTHISARVPDEADTFLINPYGLFFEEMTASDLVKVNLDGDIVDGSGRMINAAGFVIHSAVHAARSDAHFVIHLHTDHGVAVSAQRGGLLPLTQHALTILPQLAYHDYEGIAVNLDERQRLVANLADKRLMMLRNHGTLGVGSTAAEAWLGMHMLEHACLQQVMALSAGPQGVASAPDDSHEAVKMQSAFGMRAVAQLAWPGLLRRLERHLPGYDA